jgi:hypothetical protein
MTMCAKSIVCPPDFKKRNDVPLHIVGVFHFHQLHRLVRVATLNRVEEQGAVVLDPRLQLARGQEPVEVDRALDVQTRAILAMHGPDGNQDTSVHQHLGLGGVGGKHEIRAVHALVVHDQHVTLLEPVGRVHGQLPTVAGHQLVEQAHLLALFEVLQRAREAIEHGALHEACAIPRLRVQRGVVTNDHVLRLELTMHVEETKATSNVFAGLEAGFGDFQARALEKLGLIHVGDLQAHDLVVAHEAQRVVGRGHENLADARLVVERTVDDCPVLKPAQQRDDLASGIEGRREDRLRVVSGQDCTSQCVTANLFEPLGSFLA